ncbi:MAG: rod shape-determining protein RodA [Actinobacteria bacterium]|nr:rod shape-determining protein RodA [Actinomycetota bacterium]
MTTITGSTFTAGASMPPPAIETRRGLARFDFILIGASVLLSIVGVVVVYASTREQLIAQGANPHYLMDHQVEYIVVGFVAMMALALVDYRWLEAFRWIVYGGLVLALLATFTPLGSSALGAARWIQVGPVQIQPSAFGALVLIVVVAAYCGRRYQLDQMHTDALTFKDMVKLLFLAAIPILLVVKQPDLGSAIVMLTTLFVLLVVAGLPNRYTILLVLLGVVAAVAMVKLGLLHHYQLLRLTSFIHQTNNPAGAAYNSVESKAAIGSGGLFGTGLLKGPQVNLFFLPEAQTDFIFSVVGEELGFMGGAVLIFLLGVVIWRLVRIARLAGDPFGRVLVGGTVGLMAFSVFENIGMASGIMPVAGIPLPFISYGGSALLSFFACTGIALSVYARSPRKRSSISTR